MKKILVLQISLIAVVLFIAGNTASAAHRLEVHVMPESGIGIEFENLARGRGTATTDVTAPPKFGRVSTPIIAEMVTRFELPESGQVLSFPMTAGEIAAADAESERLVVSRVFAGMPHQSGGASYELSESGILIAIP